jgi:uncharacterized protein
MHMNQRTPSPSSSFKRKLDFALHRCRAMAWVLAGFAACGQATAQTAYPGGKWEPGPARYGAVVVDGGRVTMDDGVVLDASIAYPTDKATGQRALGRFPVLIEHTPYAQLAGPIRPLTYFTEHGYIYAMVRPRGAGKSGGEVQQFSSRDGRDGKAIVDWAARRLEGSDGRVGMVGCSYPGVLSLAAAAAAGPNSPIKAVLASCAGLHMQHRQGWMLNGLPTALLAAYAPNATATMGPSPAVAKYWREFHADLLAGKDLAYERAYWKDRMPLDLAQKIAANGIPVLLWGGWGDINETGAVHAYAALQNAHSGRPVFAPMAPNQPTTPRYQIIVGDWHHASGLDLGVYLQWFETWVRDVDTGLQNTRTPMHLFEPGSNRWVNLAGLPAVARYTPWFLGAKGTMTAKMATGKGGGDTLRFGAPEQPQGTLRFDTPALEAGATLSGPISATVYARSSNTNLALIAKLYDLAPNGETKQISIGAMLASQSTLDRGKTWYDQGGTAIWPWPKLDRDIYIRPGQVKRYEVSLAPRQWGVRPGHKLRLELYTQSPASICPEKGELSFSTEPCKLTAPQQRTLPGGQYTILHGPRWPSALHLPQLAANAFAAVPAGQTPTAWNETFRRFEAGPLTLPLDWGPAQ